MQFKDIDAYDSLKNHFRSLKKTKKIHHNLLLEIQDGMPGIAMALAWTQYLNCEQATEEDSCGECPSCKQIQQLQHPDLHFIFPVINSAGAETPPDNFLPQWREMNKQFGVYWEYQDWLQALNPENKQPTIYANDAPALLNKLNLTISQAKYRCVIIYLPEKMNEVTSNKLLKTMEEPPERTLFISISIHPEKLLETVYSRMQVLEMPLLSSEELGKAVLKKSPHLEDRPLDLERIVLQAQGLAGKAIKLSQKDKNDSLKLRYLEPLFRTFFTRELIVFRTLGEQFQLDGRETALQMMDYFEEAFRILYRQHCSGEFPIYIEDEEKKIMMILKDCITSRNIKEIYHYTEQAIQHIRGNVSTKSTIFDTFIHYLSVIAPEIKRRDSLLE